jgi:pyridoxal/pyridoxine/pyridoxamine kinase
MQFVPLVEVATITPRQLNSLSEAITQVRKVLADPSLLIEEGLLLDPFIGPEDGHYTKMEIQISLRESGCSSPG